jgi:hypothetical protein
MEFDPSSLVAKYLLPLHNIFAKRLHKLSIKIGHKKSYTPRFQGV